MFERISGKPKQGKKSPKTIADINTIAKAAIKNSKNKTEQEIKYQKSEGQYILPLGISDFGTDKINVPNIPSTTQKVSSKAPPYTQLDIFKERAKEQKIKYQKSERQYILPLGISSFETDNINFPNIPSTTQKVSSEKSSKSPPYTQLDIFVEQEKKEKEQAKQEKEQREADILEREKKELLDKLKKQKTEQDRKIRIKLKKDAQKDKEDEEEKERKEKVKKAEQAAKDANNIANDATKAANNADKIATAAEEAADEKPTDEKAQEKATTLRQEANRLTKLANQAQVAAETARREAIKAQEEVIKAAEAKAEKLENFTRRLQTSKANFETAAKKAQEESNNAPEDADKVIALIKATKRADTAGKAVRAALKTSKTARDVANNLQNAARKKEDDFNQKKLDEANKLKQQAEEKDRAEQEKERQKAAKATEKEQEKAAKAAKKIPNSVLGKALFFGKAFKDFFNKDSSPKDSLLAELLGEITPIKTPIKDLTPKSLLLEFLGEINPLKGVIEDVNNNPLLLEFLKEITPIRGLIENITKNQNTFVKDTEEQKRKEKEDKDFQKKEANLEQETEKPSQSTDSKSKETKAKKETSSFLQSALTILGISLFDALNKTINSFGKNDISGSDKDKQSEQPVIGKSVISSSLSSVNPTLGMASNILGVDKVIPFAEGGVINPLPNQPKIQKLPSQNVFGNDTKQNESDDIKKSFADVMTLPLKVVGASIMSSMNDFVSEMPVSDNNVISELNSFASRLSSSFGLKTSPKFSENSSEKKSKLDYKDILKSSLDLKNSATNPKSFASSSSGSVSNTPLNTKSLLSSASGMGSSSKTSSSSTPSSSTSSNTTPPSSASSTSDISGFDSKTMAAPVNNSKSIESSGTDVIDNSTKMASNYTPSSDRLNTNNYRISTMDSLSMDESSPNIITLPPNFINNNKPPTEQAPAQTFVYTAKPLRSGRQNDIRNLTISGALV